jgi:biopolymer transport protein ExbB
MKKSYVKSRMIFMVLTVFAGFLAAANAQDAAAGAAADAVKTMTFGEMWRVGGWCMWPLGAFSMLLCYFVIRNTMLLRQKTLLRADLKPEIEEKLSKGDIQGVREICQNNPSLMTSVLEAGLERITDDDFDPAHIAEAIEEAGNEQMVSFMKPINYLSVLGGTAPMVGLLGTVSGMIKAFQTIAAGGMGKPELLAGNIGEALITTAAGLIIAIPAMFSYFIFKNNFIKSMSTMGRMISHFMSVYRRARK